MTDQLMQTTKGWQSMTWKKTAILTVPSLVKPSIMKQNNGNPMANKRINALGIPGISLTEKPRMTMHRGRTWDQAKGILPAIGENPKIEVTCYLDTTWGEYFYFCYNDLWYKGKIYEFDQNRGDWMIFDLGNRKTC